MKSTLLTIHLLTAVPDTIPYIQHGYYERDTLTTTQQLKQQHYTDTQRLKDADRQGRFAMLVGVLIGVFIGVGVCITTN